MNVGGQPSPNAGLARLQLLLESGTWVGYSSYALDDFEDMIRVTPGKKMVYATDFVFCEEDVARLAGLEKVADHFHCESKCRSTNEDEAKSTKHLTAQQAGQNAQKAGAKTLHLFHHSRRHKNEPPFMVEAGKYFGGDIK